jgi:hypothetical protein
MGRCDSKATKFQLGKRINSVELLCNMVTAVNNNTLYTQKWSRVELRYPNYKLDVVLQAYNSSFSGD